MAHNYRVGGSSPPQLTSARNLNVKFLSSEQNTGVQTPPGTKMYAEYLTIGFVLFILGVLGIVLNRSNLIIMLMSIELMLLAISYTMTLFSVIIDNLIGQIFTIMVLTVAAAESAIGLAILVAYFRIRGTIAVKSLNLLRG